MSDFNGVPAACFRHNGMMRVGIANSSTPVDETDWTTNWAWDNTSGTKSGFNPNMFIVDFKLAVVHYSNEWVINGENTITLSYADVAPPEGFADWSHTEVYTEADFRAHSYLDIAGTPLIGIYRHGAGVRIPLCFTSALAKPLVLGDWDNHLVTPSDGNLDVGGGLTVASIGGFPCMSFHSLDNAVPTLTYARSIVAKPTAQTDWVISDVVFNEGHGEAFTQLAELFGKPCIAYMTHTTYELKIAMSSVPNPSVPNDWVRSDVDPGVGTQSNFEMFAEPGVLFLAYYDSATKDLKLAVLQ